MSSASESAFLALSPGPKGFSLANSLAFNSGGAFSAICWSILQVLNATSLDMGAKADSLFHAPGRKLSPPVSSAPDFSHLRRFMFELVGFIAVVFYDHVVFYFVAGYCNCC